MGLMSANAYRRARTRGRTRGLVLHITEQPTAVRWDCGRDPVQGFPVLQSASRLQRLHVFLMQGVEWKVPTLRAFIAWEVLTPLAYAFGCGEFVACHILSC